MMDPAGLQVLAAALRGVAEEMGAALVRSAHSANIKERRDCSTAVFDPEGRMIAQAEHLPVHLGAMPDAVAAVLERGAAPGEVWAINDPYTGGTHLPDITLVAIVDDLGIVCSRAHHADVGGMQPASMPAGATELLQEGVVIPPLRLTGDVRALLVANMRKPAERLADLRAQEACMEVGADRLRQLAERFGRRTLLRGMDALHDYSERRIRAGVARIPDGAYEAEDAMEGDGIHVRDVPIRVRVTVRGDRIRADFAGTADQQRGNVNCPIAVTRSAVYFCVRAVCDPDIPASGGAFVPVEVVAPEGCLVNAQPPGAVVGGNTETSSRIVDVVMSALGRAVPVPAHGQGTMNNVTFGTPGFTYYETLGGGQGGGPAGPGPSAVHVAMSNTLNTPIEALEREYPLRIERYALRAGTGGAGRHPGGDGVVRVYRVLADCRLGLMTERRRHGPHGAAGGEDGSPGANRLNGRRLPAKCSLDLKAGDILEIRTPGGGGWGSRNNGSEPDVAKTVPGTDFAAVGTLEPCRRSPRPSGSRRCAGRGPAPEPAGRGSSS